MLLNIPVLQNNAVQVLQSVLMAVLLHFFLQFFPCGERQDETHPPGESPSVHQPLTSSSHLRLGGKIRGIAWKEMLPGLCAKCLSCSKRANWVDLEPSSHLRASGVRLRVRRGNVLCAVVSLREPTGPAASCVCRSLTPPAAPQLFTEPFSLSRRVAASEANLSAP